jgi:hypothetical protein
MGTRVQPEQVAPSAADWDKYWSEERKSEAVYGVVADFYRRRIISKSLRRIFNQYISPESHCLHAGSGSGEVDRVLEICGRSLASTFHTKQPCSIDDDIQRNL